MGLTPSWSHSISLTADPTSAFRAREFVGVQLSRHGLPHVSDDLRLVVSELVSNAITHARTPFTVALGQEGQALTLTVHDQSPVLPVRAAGNDLDHGGRGLGIVDILSTDWGVTSGADGSKSVWARFGAESVVPASR